MDQVINGIALGCTYLLIALGFNVIFGVQKILNLAFGEIFMAGGFGGLAAASYISTNPIVVTGGGILTALATGLIVYLCAVRPLGNVTDINSPRHLSVIVSTIGCSLVLQNLALMVCGGYPQPFPIFMAESPRSATILNLLISAGAVLFISAAFRYTAAGLRLRAIADNPELAQCTGISAEHDRLLAVLISSGLAGLAAVLICQQIGVVSPFTGSVYGFKALVVVIVGGLGNMFGAAFVAISLGLIEALAVHYLNSSYRDAIAFSILFGVLVIRSVRRKLPSRS